jgi:myo-inositol-1(or 4)-monophosphatase
MHRIIERIAREAGDLALSHFRRLSGLAIESKGHLDLVTRADREVESLVTARLREAFPGDGVFGEEGASIPDRTGRIWVVDPIDGTFNFVRGGDQWAVSIGLYAHGRPALGVIHAPARRETVVGGDGLGAYFNGEPMPSRPAASRAHGAVAVGFHPTIPTATRLEVLRRLIDDLKLSFRCCGSATASLVELARGQVDGYVACGDSTWDVMAALPILGQLGIGSSIDWRATPLSAKLTYACGAPDFLAAVAPILDPEPPR